ncbi:nuclear transport factor 2 family protein [Portibacter lacus]|uniref:Nuclear transport factor 2 family protein n=1 Tax=Portibacter lacus TaxID=1099794 RepID=A0AA37SMX2_9BACT|nr:nuclear transport factor 2 family protein [Portibacter lacus]GLR17296.1 hypothetical protein GCM10007940_19110 [Portibacter lacus]
MKFLIFLISMVNFTNQMPQDDLVMISQVVESFVKHVDDRNIDEVNNVLHDDFRAIVNQAFGSKDVQFLTKPIYLDLMKKKEIGGDARKVVILSVDLEDKNAVVKAKFTGKELVFTTFLQLIKDSDGDWKIMSDLPVIHKI